MIKTGIYYAYWVSDWDTGFIPFIEKAGTLGFEVLEVNAGTISKMSRKERTEIRNAAEYAGISLSACIGLHPSSDIASEDISVRTRGIQHLHSIGDAMKDCGIDRLSGIIYSSWPGKLEGRSISKQQALAYSIASMKEAVKTAEDNDLVYNIEVVNRFEQFLLNTAAEAVEYVRTVDSPNLKILLDTFHMNIEENSMYDAITTAGPHLGHFHLGENNRRPPGGLVGFSWKDIFSSLHAIHYDGWAVMEPFLNPGGEVGRDISVFREIMPAADLDEEAKKSCEFIKGIIRSFTDESAPALI
ncbi:MAG: sugar phosphate isomerase/epimerase [Spirochaetia bacterium]|nr:sugar phosphate isomerase/epimerase [Spirochaetia bacterium]